MATPFKTIYDWALRKIEDPSLVQWPEEDLENVFDAMVNCTNGLLRLEKEEDDGKYDAWS